jgi:hypothetical protein
MSSDRKSRFSDVHTSLRYLFFLRRGRRWYRRGDEKECRNFKHLKLGNENGYDDVGTYRAILN